LECNLVLVQYCGKASKRPLTLLLLMKIKKSMAKAVLTPNVKTSAESPATTPVTTPKAAATTTPVSGAVTTIDVKHDVGFGNALFLRGQGGGLTWDHGVPLVCVDGKTWRWSGKVKDPLTFKLLINDKIWSAGNDLTVKPGQKLEVKPIFI
jgi:hypothetical protein